jgi:hypothetical protein
MNDYCIIRKRPSLEILFQIGKILNINPKELINAD